MAKIDDLLPAVAAYVPDAPNPAIRQAIFESYFEFCKSTRFWVGELYPASTEAKESEYYFSPLIPGHARVFDIMVLSVDGFPLESGDFHRAQGINDRPGRPRFYNFRDSNKLMLYPAPDREYTIEGEVILVPRTGTDIIDDRIYDNFALGLKHGAVFTLCSMPNKEWTNPQQAQDSVMHYSREMETARNLADGTNRKKIRVTRYGGL